MVVDGGTSIFWAVTSACELLLLLLTMEAETVKQSLVGIKELAMIRKTNSCNKEKSRSKFSISLSFLP